MARRLDAYVFRESRWWLLYIPQFDLLGQSQRRADARRHVEDLVELWTEEPARRFCIRYRFARPPHMRHERSGWD